MIRPAALHLLWLLCATALSACAFPSRALPEPGFACDSAEQRWTREVLYFGRLRPGGRSISDEEWQAFLDEVVTPKFPEGLTVTDAYGQWRNRDGVVSDEPSSVLTLLHPDTPELNRRVEVITHTYRQQFQQEAVLRDRSPSCVRFD
ncbi:MAG: DUF3574 domain-containing protein [Pseudomonadota bacterium]|nr:DUF3574 domain-containing protein [Gammaproteobacteria bacterium]MEC9357438.1 DUF3574 domain-containing protein [Pseudomonadota bacterium]